MTINKDGIVTASNKSHRSMNHNLTITLTSQEMKFLSDKAAQRGYLPVAFLKYLATCPETITYSAYEK